MDLNIDDIQLLKALIDKMPSDEQNKHLKSVLQKLNLQEFNILSGQPSYVFGLGKKENFTFGHGMNNTEIILRPYDTWEGGNTLHPVFTDIKKLKEYSSSNGISFDEIIKIQLLK